ncbi:protein S-acyltransferase 18 isoform X1 [Dioscorea cayenensis subsp. rotundata]|uniref:S-acyltransferase n=2 Tax=Dioscorea cayennensis subsp. rotundata TaxID=55577 RepID=A0AB40AHE4_DIOCR|nr:protein S-acyltransferase 18 isoform X1 [Dioscorea cayenensis subsp. rotundata]
MRRHGWQLPLHPLQMVGVVVFSFLVICFYVFLGPFLGNRIVINTVLTLFSFIAFSAALLFVRCTAIDPSDRTYRDKKRKAGKNGGMCRSRKLNYKFIIYQIAVRFIRKMEYWILRSCIRRRYLDPWRAAAPPIEPLLPFPLVSTDDAIAPHLKDNDISFCLLCDFEVKLHSKHCRSCDRCVDGFDHHCRWLNNCIGKRNYTTFILLLVFILLMLVIEGGTAIAIFVRCFADREGIASEIKQNLHTKMPRGVLIAISVLLAMLTAYTCAALGQLFFFHVVLIRKGMRTYDYILAMREESQSFDPFDDLDLSSSDDESVDLDLPEKPSFFSRFLCVRREKDPITRRLSIKIDSNPPPNTHKKTRIDPWRLIMMSKEKAVIAVERARETIIRQKTTAAPPGGLSLSPMKPIPSEAKGPLMTNKAERKNTAAASEMTPVVVAQKCWFPGSPRGWFSSPRRRFSGSPSPKQQKYKNNFDLKLTEVSRELETYISKQVLCSVLQKGKEDEASPPR